VAIQSKLLSLATMPYHTAGVGGRCSVQNLIHNLSCLPIHTKQSLGIMWFVCVLLSQTIRLNNSLQLGLAFFG